MSSPIPVGKLWKFADCTRKSEANWSSTSVVGRRAERRRERADRRDQRQPDHQRRGGGAGTPRVAQRVVAGQPAGGPEDPAEQRPAGDQHRVADAPGSAPRRSGSTAPRRRRSRPRPGRARVESARSRRAPAPSATTTPPIRPRRRSDCSGGARPRRASRRPARCARPAGRAGRPRPGSRPARRRTPGRRCVQVRSSASPVMSRPNVAEERRQRAGQHAARRTMPIEEPISAISAASSSTERRTCTPLAPSARSSASSRTRWATRMLKVLAMMKPPTRIAITANAIRNVGDHVEELARPRPATPPRPCRPRPPRTPSGSTVLGGVGQLLLGDAGRGGERRRW